MEVWASPSPGGVLAVVEVDPPLPEPEEAVVALFSGGRAVDSAVLRVSSRAEAELSGEGEEVRLLCRGEEVASARVSGWWTVAVPALILAVLAWTLARRLRPAGRPSGPSLKGGGRAPGG